MATKFYLPKKDEDKVIWLNNFAGKLPIYAATLGVTAAEVTATANDAKMFAYMVDLVGTFNSEKEERIKYKNILRDGPLGSQSGNLPTMPVIATPPTAVLPDIFKRVPLLAQRIKKHPQYTEAIGSGLNIIGAEQTIDTVGMKPALKVILKGGAVELQWKKSDADALRIEVDRGSGWTFLAVDTVPHYMDTWQVTVAATWKYRAIYLISDVQVGQWSDVASIAVG